MNLKSVLRNEINSFCKLYNQDLKNKNIVVAVSCGVDSTVLLHGLEELKDEFKYNIVIAHVNHGKREQSEIEEEYIREYAKNNGIDIEVLKLDNSSFSGTNFQEEARNIRRKFFIDCLNKYDSKYLFLAHHLNDDAETITMHLMRNSSLNGLIGMEKVSISKGIYFIRPLLDIKKEDIYDYAKEKEYKYFEDYTNSLDLYSRNKVRHNLIDKTYTGDLFESLSSYKEKMRKACEEINRARDEYIRNNVKNNSFDISSFNNLEYDLKIDCLFELLKKYELSKINIEEIIKIIESNGENGNKKVRYKNILILKEYNKVTINEYNDDSTINNELVIDEVGRYEIDKEHYLVLEKINKEDNNLKIDISNKDIICYNLFMAPFIIRKKMDGDRIKIKGGSKKVNDVLTDLKVPLSKRENVTLLIDREGNVISILGIKKSYILNECENFDIMIKTNYYNNI